MSGRSWLALSAMALAALLAVGGLAFAASQPAIGAVALGGAFCQLLSLAAWLRAGVAARAESAAMGAAMDGVAQGDFSARPRALTTESLKPLQASFDAMAASVAEIVGQLSANQGQLTAVLDTMADGVVVVDSDGRLLLSNAAAETLLGLGSADGERLSAAFRDHELQALVARCRETKAKQHAEVALPSVRRTVSAIATPLAPASGAPETSALLTIHDLTSLRRLETSRREFVANVSHELRTPLASVKAMVETLEGGAASDSALAADFLQRANREIDRMSAIVDDLLELSRMESGQDATQMNLVSLVAVAAGVRSAMEPRAEEAEVEISVHAHTDRPVLGDEGKLRQALLNLVDNALKFTPPGGRIEMDIADEGGDPASGAVRVGVRDNGGGISPEHLPHLFERFYKADRSRRSKGTGLGLAIVKSIIESHGGDIGADSEPGVGTTVWFTLRGEGVTLPAAHVQPA